MMKSLVFLCLASTQALHLRPKEPTTNLKGSEMSDETLDEFEFDQAFDLQMEGLSAECRQTIRQNKMVSKECVDPWPKTRDCKKPYQVPSYRLGDLVQKTGGIVSNKEWTQFYFPESIGAKFLARTRHKRPTFLQSTKILREIVDSDYKDYDKPDENTVVVHVRAYDALIHKGTSEVGYTRNNHYYQKIAQRALSKNLTKVMLVTGDHRVTQAADGTWGNYGGTKFTKTNMDEAISRTKAKLAEVKNIFTSVGFEADARNNWNADCDFVFMSSARYFVPSGGAFSNVISTMVEQSKGTVWT